MSTRSECCSSCVVFCPSLSLYAWLSHAALGYDGNVLDSDWLCVWSVFAGARRVCSNYCILMFVGAVFTEGSTA